MLFSMRMEPSRGMARFQATLGFFSKGTLFSSVFNLLTTSIGAGTLALPYAFSQGGLVYSSVIFFLIMTASIMVGLFLYEGKQYCQQMCPDVEVRGYEDLAEVAFGAVGRITALVTLIVFLFLTLIAYMIYTRDQLDFVIQFILQKTHHIPQCSLFTNCGILLCLAFIPLFPILLFKSLSILQFTSTVSIICVAFVAVVISVKTGIYFHDGETVTMNIKVDDNDEHIIGLFPNSFKGAITCLSYCSLAYLCHFQLFSLEKELNRPKKWKMNFIVIASMLIAYVIYNVIAIAGYLQFGGTTPEDVMTGYPNDNILVTTLRIALFFTLLFSYPVLFHPTRAAVNRLVSYCQELIRKRGEKCSIQVDQADETTDLLVSSNSVASPLGGRTRRNITHRLDSKPNLVVWFCETWALFAATFLPAVFIPNVGYVWNFVGSIGGSIILYIFPSLLYLQLRYFIKVKMAAECSTDLPRQYLQCSLWKDVVAVAIFLTGVVVLVAGNYAAVDSIIDGSHGLTASCSSLYCVYNASNKTEYW